MCWIDSQSKKLIHLKYLILETTSSFFSIFSWHFSFMYTERLKDMEKCCNIFVVCVCVFFFFYSFKKKTVLFKYF